MYKINSFFKKITIIAIDKQPKTCAHLRYRSISMSHELIERAREMMATSDFLRFCRRCQDEAFHSRLFGNKVRLLRPDEISALETRGNRCSDWSLIRVADDFTCDHIVNCVFFGQCVIGTINGPEVEIEPGVALRPCLHNSTIISSEIGSGCIISYASIISRALICHGAAIINTGSIISGEETSFGNGIEISVGIETGGREVLSFAELSLQLATAVAMERYDKEFLRNYELFVREYLEKCRLPFSVIQENAVVKNTQQLRDCFVGSYARVDGAVLLENVTVLSTKDEPAEISHGAIVRNSCVQWGAHVTTHAIVESSLLLEHSHVERHGKATHSIIGPNSGVAEGEITSSLVGPFVGFHHQALLIAALWPDGKGNVGYGANVGSNHTGKAPDQEIICGEGLFFGLGVNIKFPADYSDSPYSIIATGINALPQRVEFPFSLINKPSISYPGLSSAHNELLPGWVLTHGIYSVMRNEIKFRRRNRARRTSFSFEVLRPEIIDRMVIARNRLKNVAEPKPVYVARDIPGIGKNYLLERNRKAGIDAYNYYIEYYLLQNLCERIAHLMQLGDGGFLAEIYSRETYDPDWEYVRKLLYDEGHTAKSPKDNLRRLVEMHERVARNIQLSKEKDDGRGARIIPDYQYIHKPAGEDPFIVDFWEQTKKEIARVNELIQKCEAASSFSGIQ